MHFRHDLFVQVYNKVFEKVSFCSDIIQTTVFSVIKGSSLSSVGFKGLKGVVCANEIVLCVKGTILDAKKGGVPPPFLEEEGAEALQPPPRFTCLQRLEVAHQIINSSKEGYNSSKEGYNSSNEGYNAGHKP